MQRVSKLANVPFRSSFPTRYLLNHARRGTLFFLLVTSLRPDGGCRPGYGAFKVGKTVSRCWYAVAHFRHRQFRWMGSHRFVFGFIQRAFAGPSYDCEISMRIIESDKEKLKSDMAEKRRRTAQTRSASSWSSPMTPAVPNGLKSEAGMPPLRFGTVNDPIPSGPDLQHIEGSIASGWTTINAPVATIYAGQMPYLSPDLLQFPIANSDGTIVVSVLPVMLTIVNLT
jgi:hypothetical protein